MPWWPPTAPGGGRATVLAATPSSGRPRTAVRAPTSRDVEERELRVETWGRIGLALTVLGCALHFLGLVSRGLASDPVRVPWGNMYEFTLAGTFGVSVMYLALMKRYHLRWMGVVVTGFLVVVLMLDQLVLYQDAGPLVPALHSYWLVIHVLAAVVASGRVRGRRAGARCCSWSRTGPPAAVRCGPAAT